MKEGRDFHIIAVVHGLGGAMMLNNSAINPFISEVEALQARGVHFYLRKATSQPALSPGSPTSRRASAPSATSRRWAGAPCSRNR